MDLSTQSNLARATVKNKVQESSSVRGSTNGSQIVDGLVNSNPANTYSTSPVVTKETRFDFPTIGSSEAIYVATSENKTYRFDEANLKYYVIGSDYDDIKIINGGTASEH